MATRSGRFSVDPAVKERLSKWDSVYAPLTEKQVESYMTLMDQCVERPMPSEVIGLDMYSSAWNVEVVVLAKGSQFLYPLTPKYLK